MMSHDDPLTVDLHPKLEKYINASSVNQNVCDFVKKKFLELKLFSFGSIRGLNQLRSEKVRKMFWGSVSDTDTNRLSQAELEEFLEVCEKIVSHSELGHIVSRWERDAPQSSENFQRTHASLSILAVAETPSGKRTGN